MTLRFGAATMLLSIDGKDIIVAGMGGASGAIIRDGTLFVNSGYGVYFHMPGNVLLAFAVRADEVGP